MSQPTINEGVYVKMRSVIRNSVQEPRDTEVVYDGFLPLLLLLYLVFTNLCREKTHNENYFF